MLLMHLQFRLSKKCEIWFEHLQFNTAKTRDSQDVPLGGNMAHQLR